MIRPRSQRAMRSHSKLERVLIAWLTFALSLFACSSGRAVAPARERPAPQVVVSVVVARDVELDLHAPVELLPLEQVDVGSRMLGYLDAVTVDKGDVVTQGQLLATVRPSDLPDQLAVARRALGQQRAALELARANAARAQRMLRDRLISEAEAQSAVAALATAQANEGAARAQIDALSVRLGETQIVSPLEGVVLSRRLDPGALVGPASGGGTILTVARTSTLRATVAIAETEAAQVEKGQRVEVVLDALPHDVFEGTVKRIAAAYDSITRTLPVEVHIANHDGRLRAGMTGRARVIVLTRPARPVLPVTAVQVTAMGRYVFVVKDNKVEKRLVTTGFDAGDWLEITRGLTAGERVVTAGMDTLTDGATVRVVEGVDPFSGRRGDRLSDAGSR